MLVVVVVVVVVVVLLLVQVSTSVLGERRRARHGDWQRGAGGEEAGRQTGWCCWGWSSADVDGWERVFTRQPGVGKIDSSLASMQS